MRIDQFQRYPIGDGGRDRSPPYLRCNICLKIRPCYAGSVIATVPAARGDPFSIYQRLCLPCIQSLIDTALHRN